MSGRKRRAAHAYGLRKIECTNKSASFPTKEAADAWLAGLKERMAKQGRTRKKIPVRSYACPSCLRWHLTSKETF